MIVKSAKLKFSVVVSVITMLLLLLVRVKLGGGFLLFDRLFDGGGVFQITLITIFSAWLAYKFYDREVRVKLRQKIWLLFGAVFFLQLLLGLAVDSVFLMSGKLHFPIPSIILTGSLFRMDIGFMLVLFFITVFLSGGAWCSYLCYFGVFDSLASGEGRHVSSSRVKFRLWILLIFVVIAVLLRVLSVHVEIATWFGAASGILSLFIVLVVSRRKKTMAHCSVFCPLGTVVSYLKFISPFRYRISSRCVKCMICTISCKNGVLSKDDIYKSKPSIGCTMCGDCSVKCRHNAFEYHFLWFSAHTSELIFIGVVVVIYSLFLAIARV